MHVSQSGTMLRATASVTFYLIVIGGAFILCGVFARTTLAFQGSQALSQNGQLFTFVLLVGLVVVLISPKTMLIADTATGQLSLTKSYAYGMIKSVTTTPISDITAV